MRLSCFLLLGMIGLVGCAPASNTESEESTSSEAPEVSIPEVTMPEDTSAEDSDPGDPGDPVDAGDAAGAGDSPTDDATTTDDSDAHGAATQDAGNEQSSSDTSAVVPVGSSAEDTAERVVADASAQGVGSATVSTQTVSVAVDQEPIKVKLGSDKLTSGIPGEGALTKEEIKQWLSNPENHRPIDPQLPAGIAAAEANIQGLEDNPLTRAKIELGRQLYFDPRLSSDGSISCASCHHPDEGYTRHTQFGVGVDGQEGNRNSPVSYNRILSGPQFWDGRAATLEEQAAGPIANPIEMSNTHEVALDTIRNIDGYKMQFDAIFPGEGVTLDTLTKAIASFERAIVTKTAPYDHYQRVRAIEQAFGEDIEFLEEDDPELYADYQQALEGAEPMSESARRGMDLFFSDRVGCTACHAGANFTDEKYHNIGVGMDEEDPDLGRYEVTKKEEDKGAFKTPTCRNVIYSAPYMHDGSQKTLEEVVEWYDKGGHPNPYLSEDIKKLNLTAQEKKDLVNFMKEGLTSDFPEVETGRLPQS